MYEVCLVMEGGAVDLERVSDDDEREGAKPTAWWAAVRPTRRDVILMVIRFASCLCSDDVWWCWSAEITFVHQIHC